MSQSGTTISWRGLTMSGTHGARFLIRSFEGWEELPPLRRNAVGRVGGHGTFDSAGFSDERTIIVGGSCRSATERDALLVELQAVMTWSSSAAEPLVVTHAGRTLTGNARLTRFKPTITDAWGSGYFPWAAEWVCPDPLRYGDAIVESTGFPLPGGGLRFPLFTDGTVGVGVLDFGVAGTSGRVTLVNAGTAPASPQYAVDGPVAAEGFDIVCVETGERITFASSVAAGSTVVLDAATGRVLLNGDADKSGSVTQADWFTIPAGGSRTVGFLPRGTTSAATLTATVRPPWW